MPLGVLFASFAIVLKVDGALSRFSYSILLEYPKTILTICDGYHSLIEANYCTH